MTLPVLVTDPESIEKAKKAITISQSFILFYRRSDNSFGLVGSGNEPDPNDLLDLANWMEKHAKQMAAKVLDEAVNKHFDKVLSKQVL